MVVLTVVVGGRGWGEEPRMVLNVVVGGSGWGGGPGWC